MNPRYQKNTAPAGKTKRSASAAKPKREAGAQTGSTSVKKSSATKPAQRQSLREAWRSMPSSPEMKRWRRIWLALIAAALLVAVVVGFVPGIRDNRTALMAGTVVYVITLGAAVYIDFAVIRPLRNKAVAEQKAAEKKGKS
jgi:Flp pilus assembly protein TadB